MSRLLLLRILRRIISTSCQAAFARQRSEFTICSAKRSLRRRRRPGSGMPRALLQALISSELSAGPLGGGNSVFGGESLLGDNVSCKNHTERNRRLSYPELDVLRFINLKLLPRRMRS